MLAFNRTKSKPSKLNATPWQHSIQIVVFEPRLVLSAQSISDITHHAMLGDSWSSLPDPLDSNPTEIDGPNSGVSVEQHLQQAHQASGWTQAHQSYGLTGSGQTVAVIDSGIAWDHVALGRGFGPGYRVVGGWDFAENDASPYDDRPAGFHGTHVSGIVGANDGVHFGVAPDVDLVALRVFDDAGKGQLAWVEQALQWVHQNRNAFENPITTVNLSLGSTWNSENVPNWATFENEFQQLSQDGIVVVASAGNSFAQYQTPGLSYPAASPYVIPVASVDDNGQLSSFSQRHDRVIAAPGRNIDSTVPDHVYGTDGNVNDWATASGTSMAAPYVSGAAVLVREAMEMSGWSSINSASIYRHLQDTADSVWDSVTSHAYDRLNLQRALDAILPDDNVGGNWSDAQNVHLHNVKTTDGWINTLNDRDAYRFTSEHNGKLSISLDSQYLDDTNWALWQAGVESSGGTGDRLEFNVRAGQSYAFALNDSDSIGTYRLNWQFDISPAGGTGNGPPAGVAPTDLGRVDHLSKVVAGRDYYSLQATHDGILSVVYDSQSSANGQLQVRDANGTWHSDVTLENGQYRIDLDVVSGASLQIVLPGSATPHGELEIVNLLQQTGRTVQVAGTSGSDRFEVDLRDGISIQIGSVAYQFENADVQTIQLVAAAGSDTLIVYGSSLAEKVELRSNAASIVNSNLAVLATGIEQVEYTGGGGPDRVYLYDAASDDKLTARPNEAELVGVGYRFKVSDVERVYAYATAGGLDQAFLYDSSGNDLLSVRPQFSSLRGEGFFNYINGFDRVYAYATGGGLDSAQLYDSAGNDRFSTSGEVASLVGPGLYGYTRYFDKVEVFAKAGGIDVAALYAKTSGGFQSGSDFVGLKEAGLDRLARGFEQIQTYVRGTLQSPPASGLRTNTMDDVSDTSPELPQSVAVANQAPACPSNSATRPVYSVSYQAQAIAANWNESYGPQLVQQSTIQPQNVHPSEPLIQPDWVSFATSESIESLASEVLQQASELQQWLDDQVVKQSLHTDFLLVDNPSIENDLLDRIFRNVN